MSDGASVVVGHVAGQRTGSIRVERELIVQRGDNVQIKVHQSSARAASGSRWHTVGCVAHGT
jgi:hypothetical protein